jgi:proline dehydrogenase
MVDVSGVLKLVPTRDSIVAALDGLPAAQGAISPFVPGETVGAAVPVVQDVIDSGMSASVAYLPAADSAVSARLIHMATIDALDSAHVAEGSDLMVDLAALGMSRGVDQGQITADLAALCAAAEQVGMTVTVAGVAHRHLDAALAVHSAVAAEHPDLGMTVSASLLRAEADCGDLARRGSRVRLVRQEAAEPEGISFTDAHEIDKSYVRCTRLLMAMDSRIVVATHDPQLIEIASALAVRSDRDPAGFSFQFRLGVRPDAAADLVSTGARVGILVPFGPDWATYLSTRIALRPNSVLQAARAALGR